MKLDTVLEHIESARLAHLRWVARAEALVEGLPLDKNQVPVLPTDCIFGQWYYGDGHKLRGMNSYAALEDPHRALHYTYQAIFRLLYGEDDRSMLSKLFGSKKSWQDERREEAEELLPRLRSESKVLLQALDLLEREVSIKAKKGVIDLEKTLDV